MNGKQYMATTITGEHLNLFDSYESQQKRERPKSPPDAGEMISHLQRTMPQLLPSGYSFSPRLSVLLADGLSKSNKWDSCMRQQVPQRTLPVANSEKVVEGLVE